MRFLCNGNPNEVTLPELDTYGECDPDVQLCVLLLEDTDDFISFWKLIEVELNNLRNKQHVNVSASANREEENGKITI